MANFTARFTGGTVVADWFDPASLSRPSRLNNTSGIVPKYDRVSGPLVTIACTPAGMAEGVSDSFLGGNLFTCWFAEWSGVTIPTLFQAVGLSSVITFSPAAVGHYLIVIYRPAGGGQCLRLFA